MSDLHAEQVAQLVAKREIADVLHRYCEIVDHGDVTRADEVWHPDAVLHYEGTFHGTAGEFMEWIAGRRAVNRAMAHFVTNELIDVAGDRATSRCYLMAHIHTEDGSHSISWGTFTDRWSHRDGRWRIDERHHERKFSTTLGLDAT